MLNAVGKPVPASIRAWMLKKHAEKHPSSASPPSTAPASSTKSANAMHASLPAAPSLFISSFENELLAGGPAANCMHAMQLPHQSDWAEHACTSAVSPALVSQPWDHGIHHEQFVESMHASFSAPLQPSAATTDQPLRQHQSVTVSGYSTAHTSHSELLSPRPAEVLLLAVNKKTEPFMVMIDGGSNYNVFGHPMLPSLGLQFDAPSVDIAGWNSSSTYVDSHYTIDLLLTTTRASVHKQRVVVGYSPSARRHILSESVMWDTAGWTVLKEPHMCITTPVGSIPLIRINGLDFFEACLTVRPPMMCKASTMGHEFMLHRHVVSGQTWRPVFGPHAFISQGTL